MERLMSVEEKIRRAEEIYQRRRQEETRPIAKVSINDKKDIKLLKKDDNSNINLCSNLFSNI